MRHYAVTDLCALSGVTRQAFYKHDDDLLFRRLAIGQFVVHFVLSVREKDPQMGSDNLWRMYRNRFNDEYRVGRDVFRSILHGKTFTSLRQVTEAVKTAVLFYNSERPHSSIDWHTPDEAHQMQGEMKRHWHSWREDAIKRQHAAAV